MQKGKPPFAFVSLGRTYRCDFDQTHTPMFHQLEGVLIDRHIHMGHMKYILEHFLKSFFGLDEIRLRMRPSYFPFTEPSMEVDIGCTRSQNRIEIGKGKDWLEILGCGMVHQNVLDIVGVDKNIYQGFAFGVGVDRLAMLKYGIYDLRLLFEGDLRPLRHYGMNIFGDLR